MDDVSRARPRRRASSPGMTASRRASAMTASRWFQVVERAEGEASSSELRFRLPLILAATEAACCGSGGSRGIERRR